MLNKLSSFSLLLTLALLPVKINKQGISAPPESDQLNSVCKELIRPYVVTWNRQKKSSLEHGQQITVLFDSLSKRISKVSRLSPVCSHAPHCTGHAFQSSSPVQCLVTRLSKSACRREQDVSLVSTVYACASFTQILDRCVLFVHPPTPKRHHS